MTHIKLTRVGGKITHVYCSGHTGYANSGEDIVCAAISSVVQTTLLGLLNVVKCDVKFKRDDKKGQLEFELAANLSEQKRHDCDVLLETMLCALSDLHTEYSDFLSLEVM